MAGVIPTYMRNPDEIDLEIIRLLIEDARRPYSEIATRVGLTPPAVSDRVTRLEEIGIIQRFTLDVDRTTFRNRFPVVIQLTVKPEAVERVFDRVYDLDGTEHAFQLFDGNIIDHVNAPDRDVHSWFRDIVEMEDITSSDITPVADTNGARGLPHPISQFRARSVRTP